MKKPRIAVLGATGVVGERLQRLLTSSELSLKI